MSDSGSRKFGRSTLELIEGDITDQQADAIVNAANSRLGGGGGVDGAIHRRGGPSILEECLRIGGCPTGEARATGAGELCARFVIHAVGPVYRDGRCSEPELLAAAYENSLLTAEGLALRTLAFPSLSTGAYGYPLADAASIALTTVSTYLGGRRTSIERVRFVLFDASTLAAYRRALARC
ncbi:MAG: O-acetyl-ADP-ribose deacetylase [Acidobacteriota bacterium]|nr:O-acetyl-ADP-ribose deacetylase [Acidobacteriota bacterium]